MPDRAMHLKSKAGSVTFLAFTLFVVVCLQAADAVVLPGTFGEVADKYGLGWAVALVLGGYTLRAYYKQNAFVQDVMIGLVRDVTSCIDRNTDALRDAPCGKDLKIEPRSRSGS